MNDLASSLQQEAQPMSLREHKKRQAQAVIEEAALRLFQRQGYEHTSIQDIADAVQMSPRTFFRYFASKEEVLSGPMYAMLNEGIRSLQQVASTESPHAVLKAILVHLANLCQPQRASFLIRFQVAAQTPSIASAYLYALMGIEPKLCDALCAHLETATSRNEIRLLVGIYMTAFRAAIEVWVKNGAQGDLLPLLHEHLEYLASLAQNV